ncbi:MAG: outer membrane lipoprotein-sorting protein [Bacteroidetes bacterium]|nr:MAG: outer membrane lipoprotein-sorting protein [Bacteroidota bacterium]
MTVGFPPKVSAQSAVEIVQKSIDLINGQSSQATITMTITRPKYTRSLEMKTWSSGSDYFMVYIASPAQEKGQVFMKRETDMWNWIPKISRMIKIPPSMMSQSWMGSDFTNDDLVKVNSLAVDYTHSIQGEEVIEGYECYKIELIPTLESAVVWGKVNMWIAKTESFQMKMEYYDEDMELVNLMEASDVKQFGDRKLPAKMVMTPVKKEGQQTMMVTSEQTFNVDIDQGFFSQQNMKKVR